MTKTDTVLRQLAGLLLDIAERESFSSRPLDHEANQKTLPAVRKAIPFRRPHGKVLPHLQRIAKG